MGRVQIVDPGASWTGIYPTRRVHLVETTLNSSHRCLKLIDTFRHTDSEPLEMFVLIHCYTGFNLLLSNHFDP